MIETKINSFHFLFLMEIPDIRFVCNFDMKIFQLNISMNNRVRRFKIATP